MAAVTTFSVCLGIAVDDTIHLISRYCLERKRGQDTAIAVRQAAGKVGAALTVTTLTLLGGFGAGFLSDLPAMRLFSLLSCIALIAALAGSVLILPALLVCFDNRKSQQADARPRLVEIGSR
jgi:predicted RND superfamily exporter protein